MNSKNLQNMIDIADIHALRIEKALYHIKPLQPITESILANLSDENLGFLELLTSRFAKLQDFISSKIFPQILSQLLEETDDQSLLDRLNKLEKIGLLPSAKAWIEMRYTRNFITHEYPDDPKITCENLNTTIDQAKKLIDYWNFLRQKIL